MNRRAFSRVVGLALAAIPFARPAVTVAQGATPADVPASGGIGEMLALIPASLPALENPAQLMISYADIATQLDVTGVTPPDSMDDPGFSQWIGATQPLAMPLNAAQYLKFWREDYGFDLFQAEQTLWLSLPPFDLSLFRGRFDLDAVRATLNGNGYQEIEVKGHPLLSLRDDFEQDVASDFAYKLAAMNHAAILPDGTLAFSSVKAALAAVLDVVSGQAPSMMEQAGIAILTDHAPDDLVSALIANGTMLSGNIPPELFELGPDATPDISAIATEIAQTSEMPPVAMVLLGSTAGGPLFGQNVETPTGVPDAHAVAVALMLTPEMAEMAVPVVEERLETGESAISEQPYSDLFTGFEVRAVPSTPVVVIDLSLGETSPNVLANMLYARDLGFLAW